MYIFVYALGPCPVCPKTSQQFCQCGRNSTVRPCESPVWQCSEVSLNASLSDKILEWFCIKYNHFYFCDTVLCTFSIFAEIVKNCMYNVLNSCMEIQVP